MVRVQVVRLLVERNAESGVVTAAGGTLHIAAAHGPIELFELLLSGLSRASDPNLLDAHGKTAMHYLSESNQPSTPEKMRLMLERGGRADCLDAAKRLPIDPSFYEATGVVDAIGCTHLNSSTVCTLRPILQ